MVGPLQNWEKMTALPVAVLGAGVSGEGVCSLLKRLGWNYRVFDDAGISLTLNKLRSSSLVVVSPGFRPDHPWLMMAREMKLKVFGELDFASCFCASPITAITGTNGKTTIATLLNHVFNFHGLSSKTAGNIGLPLSKLISEQVNLKSRIFLEVSSFQSRMMTCLEAEQGIWTNFAEDHLDFHGSMEDYFQSKLSLIRRCKERVFVGESVARWARRFSLELPTNSVVVQPLKEGSFNFHNNSFLDTFPQRENLALAKSFAESLDIPAPDFMEACKSYKPESHRLSKVHEVEDITFWNDSKATNFDAVISACRSVDGPIFWIGGGQSKGVPMEEFARELTQYIDRAFVIGEVSDELSRRINFFGKPAEQCFSLTEAVDIAFNEARSRTSILLSPGFASFDQFSDYSERGRIFNQSALNLKKRFATTTQELLY